MTSLLLSSSVATATATAVPLTVVLRQGIKDISDFAPFDDLETLSENRNRDSLDDAFSFRGLIEDGIDGGQEIFLLETGCMMGDHADCPRACNDPSVFFGSLETFYNCAALASIAYWTHESPKYYVSDEAERNASVLMGDGTLREFDQKPVLDKFIACAHDACENDGLSVGCSDSITNLSRDSSTTGEILDAIGSFCPQIEAEVNPDIFGPGVLISYVLQVSFATMLYLCVKLFTIWARVTQVQTPRRRPHALTRIRTMIWPDTSALSRTSVAIATTLVEFQEAQCWFVFALQIASILAIVVSSQEGSFWGEIVVNAAVAFHVSQNGILPMFLIQICLHNEGIRSTHTFLGFCIEYILAIVAASQKVYFRDVFELFRSQTDLAACGGNPSPRTYCAAISAVDGLNISFFPHPLVYKLAFLVLDTIAIIVLIVDQVAWELRKHTRTRHMRVGSFHAGRGPQGRFKPHWVKFKNWFWHTLEFVYIIVNILYMVSLIRVIRVESFDPSRWSYGQIIAMTVWGPVIVKLFDLVLSGPPKNGPGEDSGPPRLRIDNLINRRFNSCSMNEFGGGPPPKPPPTTLDLSGSNTTEKVVADDAEQTEQEQQRPTSRILAVDNASEKKNDTGTTDDSPEKKKDTGTTDDAS